MPADAIKCKHSISIYIGICHKVFHKMFLFSISSNCAESINYRPQFSIDRPFGNCLNSLGIILCDNAAFTNKVHSNDTKHCRNSHPSHRNNDQDHDSQYLKRRLNRDSQHNPQHIIKYHCVFREPRKYSSNRISIEKYHRGPK